jgi:hypoxanthine phosphoribosyltransferase
MEDVLKPPRMIQTDAEFRIAVAKIAEWARNQPVQFKSVYGIPKGGIILAAWLAYRLDISLLLSVGDITPSTLIVDDIIDSGSTMDKLFRMLLGKEKGYRVASIFWNMEASRRPDFFVYKRTKWIQFPWETEETSRVDGTEFGPAPLPSAPKS